MTDARQYQRDLIFLMLLIGILLMPFLLPYVPLDLSDFPEAWNWGLREPIDEFQRWVIGNRAAHPLFVWFFQPLSQTIDSSVRAIETVLLWLPWSVVMLAGFFIGLQAGGLRIALLTSAGLLGMGLFGLWAESMQTFALMGVAVFFSLLIGIPLGILASQSDRVAAILRPLLDAMQTMPAFVYLIPVLLFFGIARVPSVVATMIYALPPAIRLTNLGIRGVSTTAIEAAHSFGSTRWQTLLKVQLPLAMPAIMVGVNQTIMMALAIVVIAALIGAGGLGREVLIALQRLSVGEGVEAGLAIVFMAIILDRVSHGFSQRNSVAETKRQQGFMVLPNGWQRLALARQFEHGLARLGTRCQQVAETVVLGLIKIIVQPFKPMQTAISTACRPYAGRLAVLLLLGSLLLLDNFVVDFGPFPETWNLQISQPIDSAVDWMRDNLYQIGDLPLGTGPLSDFLIIYALNPLRSLFKSWLVWPLFILFTVLLTNRIAGQAVAAFSMVGLMAIGWLGMWEDSMDTLSQVVVAVGVTAILAIPLGILSAKSDIFESLLRPVLDLLQTIPPFVYLVPVIMLFNVGRVPGIIASVIYALPPGVRLTSLGLRQVSPQAIEAAQSFGSTDWQTLLKVQLPLAWPTIMLGLNQIVMMVLAMVIIAGLVGGGGLGLEAVTGLAKNQTGRGIEAGLAIVIMAMILDRMTQGRQRAVK